MFERFLELWKAMDLLFDRVEEHPWGAVITDHRFPKVHDANYARVDHGDTSVTELMKALLPAIEQVGAEEIHIVMTDPDDSSDLIASLSSAGHRLGWDEVMVH